MAAEIVISPLGGVKKIEIHVRKSILNQNYSSDL